MRSGDLHRRVPGRPIGAVDHLERVFIIVAVGFEALGAAAIVIGFLVSVAVGIRSVARREGGVAAFSALRTTLGGALLLGLELLVAADLIRTITSKPSLEDALMTRETGAEPRLGYSSRRYPSQPEPIWLLLPNPPEPLPGYRKSVPAASRAMRSTRPSPL